MNIPHPDDMTRIATVRESIDEWRYNCGAPADRAWILSDRDTWERNPRYDGPPVPHPEDGDESPNYQRGYTTAAAEARRLAEFTGRPFTVAPVADRPFWFVVR